MRLRGKTVKPSLTKSSVSNEKPKQVIPKISEALPIWTKLRIEVARPE